MQTDILKFILPHLFAVSYFSNKFYLLAGPLLTAESNLYFNYYPKMYSALRSQSNEKVLQTLHGILFSTQYSAVSQ